MSGSEVLLARFLALHPREIDLSLGRIERLLAALGHPERRLPPVAHIAGTNGKGSTAAFIRAMSEAAGRRVHVYTSPHLVRFHERIRLAGRLVDEDRLVAALEEVERVNAGEPITFFEIITAAAFLLFSAEPADLLVLEVGLGGRLDATNVVAAPAATVITPVSIDHTKFLGTTIAEIAFEKAGILKRDVPAVVARQSPEATAVIARQAARAGAPLHVSGQHWHVHEEGGRLVFQDENGLLDLPLPRLAGRHQHENAGAAIAALRAGAGLGVPAAAIEAGLREVDWPARLQRLKEGPLPALLPTGAELWLDGAHNPDGGRALAAAIGDLETRVPRPLVLITGMINTKDSEGFLDCFAGLARRVHTVPITGHAAARPPAEVAEIATRAGLAATPHDTLQAALGAVRTAGERPPRVLIAGSLYLAGEVLAANGMMPE